MFTFAESLEKRICLSSVVATTVQQLTSTARSEVAEMLASQKAVILRARSDILHAEAVPMDIGCTRTVRARVKALIATIDQLRMSNAAAVARAERSGGTEKEPRFVFRICAGGSGKGAIGGGRQ